MNGRFKIDGIDAFDEFGMWVLQYGYAGLIQRPTFKTLNTTSWPDEDGDEIDLDDVVLDSRSFQIQFGITNVRFAEDFFYTLANGSYHTFEFPELGKSYKLRLSQTGSFSQHVKMGSLTLTFCDDFPAIPSQEPYDVGEVDILQGAYLMDGLYLSQFGVLVLQGTDESIRQAAAVKENLKISNKETSGILYDEYSPKFKTKDVTLKLLINCTGVQEFWKRYDALFSALMQSGSRELYYPLLDNACECHYKSMSVTKFDVLHTNRVWCEFTVTLTVTNYRPVSQYVLLEHEDNTLVEVLTNGGADTSLIYIRPMRDVVLLIHQDGSRVVVQDGEEEAELFLNN